MAKQEPISLLAFQEQFATEDACRNHLFNMRWPNGFHCPRCGDERFYELRHRNLYQCGSCRYQVSVTSGTLLHRTRIPLRKWFWAIFLVIHDKRGVSALQLSRTLDLRYETAWLMLHKIREAMRDRDAQYPLEGLVEMDDGYFGGVDHGRHGRGVKTPPVILAVGVGQGAPTFAKMAVVERVTKAEIASFAKGACDPTTVIKTDGLNRYRVLDELGFQHTAVVTKYHPKGGGAFPYVHTLISNTKAWLVGTFHGAVRRKYLARYLDEYCYRFNRRNFAGEGFNRLLYACAVTTPVPFAELTG